MPLAWPREPGRVDAGGFRSRRLSLQPAGPSSFFLMQSFAVNNKDVLYVSTAPVTELQKFLNLVFSVVYPLLNAKTTLGY